MVVIIIKSRLGEPPVSPDDVFIHGLLFDSMLGDPVLGLGIATGGFRDPNFRFGDPLLSPGTLCRNSNDRSQYGLPLRDCFHE